MTNTCAHANCGKEGTFPAPRDPRNLGTRQYFCAEHIKEFNKNWNGLNGFNETEIFSLQHGAATWNRPTWTLGVNKTAPNAPKLNFSSAEELLKFFREREVKEAKVKKMTGTARARLTLPADVKEACGIFTIPEPMSGAQLRARYLELVKQHHPDVNKGSSDSEETLKRINVAYQILERYSVQSVL
jgi:hypothetical protein